MADDWGGTSGTGAGGDWGGYDKNLQNWQGYLQNQMGGYNMKQPTAPDITQDDWGGKHQAVMDDMLSGQRNQLDDYVRRVSAAGVQRGGYAQGGTQPGASTLQYNAIKDLSSGYGNRYNDALNYMMKLGEFEQGQYQNQQQQLANLWGAQGQAMGLQGQNVGNQRQYDIAMKQLQDEAAKRQWQTGERVGTQQWQGGQNTQQRELEMRLKSMGIDADMARQLAQQQWQTGESAAQRGWQSGEAAKEQGWKTGERTGTQEWQGAQNAQQQQWQGQQNQAQRNLQIQLQKMGMSADMAKLLAQQQFQMNMSMMGW